MSTPLKDVLTKKQIEQTFVEIFSDAQKKFPSIDPFSLSMVMMYGSSFIAYSSIPKPPPTEEEDLVQVFLATGRISYDYLTTPTTSVDAPLPQSSQDSEVQGTN